jgi:iron complex transport system substrate-binding protein
VLLLGVVTAIIALPRVKTVWREHQRGIAFPVAQGDSFPVTVVDTFGHRVTVNTQPKRIVSLAPGVTEILYAIGANGALIADTSYCDFPPAAAALPKIGGYLDPNVEKVLAMKPDLIVGERGNRKEVLLHLHGLGRTIVVVDPESLDGVTQSILMIGRVTGKAANARKLADGFAARQRRVVDRLAGVPESVRPRTLFLFSLGEGIFTVGPGSHIDELIRLAGGKNIAALTGKPWPQLSMEAVMAADPQVILLLRGQMTNHPITTAQALARFRADTHWRSISAVREGKIVLLDDDPSTIPGPRLIDGLEEMASALHPDLFPREARR